MPYGKQHLQSANVLVEMGNLTAAQQQPYTLLSNASSRHVALSSHSKTPGNLMLDMIRIHPKLLLALNSTISARRVGKAPIVADVGLNLTTIRGVVL